MEATGNLGNLKKIESLMSPKSALAKLPNFF